MSKDDGRRSAYQQKAAKLGRLLEEKHYDTLDEFYVDNKVTRNTRRVPATGPTPTTDASPTSKHVL
jgi:hypothetical protein